MIDLARWFVGDIAQVSGRLTTNVARLRPDGTAMASLNDSATVLLEFANTAQATIKVSGASVVGQSPEVEVRLYGDEGSLKLDFDLINAHASGRWRDDQSWNELSIPEDLSASTGENQRYSTSPPSLHSQTCPSLDRLFVDPCWTAAPLKQHSKKTARRLRGHTPCSAPCDQADAVAGPFACAAPEESHLHRSAVPLGRKAATPLHQPPR